MISYTHKCIFIHIPKAGGSSIEKIIWPSKTDRTEKNLWKGHINASPPYRNKYQTGGLQHLLAKQVKEEVGESIYNACYKFTIVRNPWDKVISQFIYMQGRKDLQEYIGVSDVNSLKEYLGLTQKKEHIQWASQVSFILDDNGNKLVDFIGRFETYEISVREVLGRLGLGHHFFGLIKTKIPHQKKGQRKKYQEYYDEESREMVQAIYQEDIEYFNYAY